MPQTAGRKLHRTRGASPASAARRSVVISAVSWSAAEELDLHGWLEQGQKLGAMGRAAAWWIGDWITFGNARFGEKYSRAARITGYDPQTLMNMAYVASRFDFSRRREKLSWSHHAELAAQAPEEQERWLDLAERERLSVHSLRLELRQAGRTAVEEVGAGDTRAQLSSGPEEKLVTCPECRHRFPLEKPTELK